jgi:hypothetical protein
MTPSGMCRRVDIMKTDVSEECRFSHDPQGATFQKKAFFNKDQNHKCATERSIRNVSDDVRHTILRIVGSLLPKYTAVQPGRLNTSILKIVCDETYKAHQHPCSGHSHPLTALLYDIYSFFEIPFLYAICNNTLSKLVEQNDDL